MLLGVAILICGMVIGAGGALTIGRGMALRWLQRSDHLPQSITARLKDELHLSPQQAAQVQGIVAKRLGNVARIREASRPQVEEQFKLMEDEVAGALDANQAKLWRQRFEQLQRLRAHPPGPPGPGQWHRRHRPGS